MSPKPPPTTAAPPVTATPVTAPSTTERTPARTALSAGTRTTPSEARTTTPSTKTYDSSRRRATPLIPVGQQLDVASLLDRPFSLNRHRSETLPVLVPRWKLRSDANENFNKPIFLIMKSASFLPSFAIHSASRIIEPRITKFKDLSKYTFHLILLPV